MSLQSVIARGKTPRVIGFDDAPFDKAIPYGPVSIAGIVCNGTRFEGMVWGEVTHDGNDATDAVIELLVGGKFLEQLHCALFDGIAFGGFNVIDLPRLAQELAIPCVAVMRNHPDLDAIDAALDHLDGAARRRELLRRAGTIHRASNVWFQVAGAEPELVQTMLDLVTRTGHIPEPIRMAHLIGAAVVSGESGRRA